LTPECVTPINSRFREALQTPDFGFFAWRQAWGLNFCRREAADRPNGDAHVAQLVEHVLGKDEVIGSNPIVGSSRRHSSRKQAAKTS